MAWRSANGPVTALAIVAFRPRNLVVAGSRSCRSGKGTGSRCGSGACGEAVGKPLALVQALTNDYERFEALVGARERSSG